MGVFGLKKQVAQVPASEGVLNVGAVFKGTLLGYAVTLAMFLIFAAALTVTDFPEKMIRGAVVIATVISVIAGGTVAGRSARTMGWLNGTVTGVFYVVLLYLLSGLFTRNYTIDGGVLTTLGIGLVSGAAGGVIGINMRGKSRAHAR